MIRQTTRHSRSRFKPVGEDDDPRAASEPCDSLGRGSAASADNVSSEQTDVVLCGFGQLDLDDETVFIDRTRDEVLDAPAFDESRADDAGYLEELGAYYATEATLGNY